MSRLVNALMGDESVLSNLPVAWLIDYREVSFCRLIGQGQTGLVYTCQVKGKEAAVKKLRSEYVTDIATAQLFLHEIKLLSTLSHKNIMSFLGAVLPEPDAKDYHNMYMVSKYYEHGTLSSLIQSKDYVLSWRTKLRMCIEVAQGVQYLHAHNVIQRDLKTSNILVDSNYTIKIADFGLATRVKDGSMVGAPLGRNAMCGTPATMAPEIWRQQPYDERVDIFSLAVVFWELVTRKKPYSDLQIDGLALVNAVAAQGLRPQIPIFCPSELAELIVECWDNSPVKRPEAKTVVQRLEDMTKLVETAVDKLVAEGAPRGFRSPLLRRRSRSQPDINLVPNRPAITPKRSMSAPIDSGKDFVS